MRFIRISILYMRNEWSAIYKDNGTEWERLRIYIDNIMCDDDGWCPPSIRRKYIDYDTMKQRQRTVKYNIKNIDESEAFRLLL